MIRKYSQIGLAPSALAVLFVACLFLLGGCSGEAPTRKPAAGPKVKSERKTDKTEKKVRRRVVSAKKGVEGSAPAEKQGFPGRAPGLADVTKPGQTGSEGAKVASAGRGGVSEKGTDDAYRYDPRGKPDPFRPPFRSLGDNGPSTPRTKTPLQRFELDQIHLVAIIWGIDQKSKALMRDPSGTEYIVAVGTPIGKHEGEITRIDDSRIWIKEKYVDYLGRESEKDVVLKIETDRAKTTGKKTRRRRRR